MKINIISFGKFKRSDPYSILYNEYRKRVNFDIKLTEIKGHTVSTSIEEQKEYEGAEILKKINENNKVIVLDERGKIITTNEFADIINRYMNYGDDIDFIIGGANGLSNNVLKQADFILSLGRMVYPHLMVRVMLMEQLYRVYTINNNHPYHK